MKEHFRRAATRVSNLAGTATVFLLAVGLVAVWACTGPIFNFSDTWQLVINTGTTIVTFLMVFLIQNTQNRDGKAIQIKLDELIRATKGARTQYVGLEEFSDQDLATLEEGFRRMAQNPDSQRAIEKMRTRLDVEHSRRHKNRPSVSTDATLDTSADQKTPLTRDANGHTYRKVGGRMLPRHRARSTEQSRRVLR